MNLFVSFANEFHTRYFTTFTVYQFTTHYEATGDCAVIFLVWMEKKHLHVGFWQICKGNTSLTAQIWLAKDLI